jgi:hypothetical protein
LRTNCLLKHVTEEEIEGRIQLREDEEEDVSRYWMTTGKERILEIQTGSTKSHSVENSVWKRLWTCRKI